VLLFLYPYGPRAAGCEAGSHGGRRAHERAAPVAPLVLVIVYVAGGCGKDRKGRNPPVVRTEEVGAFCVQRAAKASGLSRRLTGPPRTRTNCADSIIVWQREYSSNVIIDQACISGNWSIGSIVGSCCVGYCYWS